MQTHAKIIHCVGKHKADPMGANFKRVLIDPSGRYTSEDRVASIGRSHVLGKIPLTRSNDTESLAALKSRVSISEV